jgi:hypothetical protein
VRYFVYPSTNPEVAEVELSQVDNTNYTAHTLASLILQVVFPTSGVVELVRSMELKWGFEFLRDGDHLQEHLARFRPGGNYYGGGLGYSLYLF